MSGNTVVFAVSLPIDLCYLAVACLWVYRDAQLQKVDHSLRRLRRWVLAVTVCFTSWQILIYTPWQEGKPATHIPSEIALSGMMLAGYWVGYLWVGDWCGYYFAKFRTPFPNAVYYAFGVASVLSGVAAALRSIVPFLLDDLWLYDLFFLIYMIPLVFGMACCVKLAWDVRAATKQKYFQVLTSADEEEQPFINSSRRIHMCKVNFLIVYFALAFFSTLYWVPTFISNLQTIKPGTPLHTRPEVPVGLAVGTAVSFWIPYALILWYSKFEWKKDPLDIETKDETMAPVDGGDIHLDTM